MDGQEECSPEAGFPKSAVKRFVDVSRVVLCDNLYYIETSYLFIYMQSSAMLGGSKAPKIRLHASCSTRNFAETIVGCLPR